MRNVLDLFCGAAGGWSLGLERAGYRTVAACELDPWRRSVFAAAHPGCRMYADVRELTAEQLRADLGYLPDVVVGSPPCQEISAANTKGKGITDDHLFWDWARLAFEIRPVWCAAENSPNARTEDIDGILDALDQARYAFWSSVVGADNAGANHRRKRLWLIAADAERLGYFSGSASGEGRRPEPDQRNSCHPLPGPGNANVEHDGADALRHELWQQSGRGGGTNGRRAAVAGEHDPDAHGRLARGARRHADGCVELGARADGDIARDADIGAKIEIGGFRCGPHVEPARTAEHATGIAGLRLGGILGRNGDESAQVGLYDDHDAARIRCGEGRPEPIEQGQRQDRRTSGDAAAAVGEPRTRIEGQERQSWPEVRHDALPPELRAIGDAWPHWNGGISGLSAACVAAGFGAVDDGSDAILAPGLRNRAIAALGDAVIPVIPQAIGRAMTSVMFA